MLEPYITLRLPAMMPSLPQVNNINTNVIHWTGPPASIAPWSRSNVHMQALLEVDRCLHGHIILD